VSFALANNGPADVTLSKVTLAGLDGATAACSGVVPRGRAYSCAATGRVPADAAVTGPYWTPRSDAARYTFETGVPFGLPFRPSPFRATFQLSIAGADVRVERVLQFRYDNVTAGEKRMELSVVPAFAVRLTPDIVVLPARPAASSASRARDVQVIVTNQHKGAAAGTVTVTAPAGWTVTPAQRPVTFAREDEEVTVAFALVAPAGIGVGEYPLTAVVSDASGSYSVGYDVVEYPHTERRQVPKTASARVKVIDVSLAPDVSVGYVMGVGDQVPQALSQLGAAVSLLSPADLASGDLSKYSVIVTGVRAYERRPDLRANNHRLLAYAENGGTVLVQYNKFEFNAAQYGPYPAKVSADRVTDENAPIEVLVPGNPIFSTPNRLGPDTWANWVQERGLYFLGERDPRYVDLVRSSDPFDYNRGEKTGALVEARVGKGRWIYVGLGLWRQLPAGTPGAYRLMANLISLH
jgi:alpha-galactosidase-like protein